jgi:hypothetical protein
MCGCDGGSWGSGGGGRGPAQCSGHCPGAAPPTPPHPHPLACRLVPPSCTTAPSSATATPAAPRCAPCRCSSAAAGCGTAGSPVRGGRSASSTACRWVRAGGGRQAEHWPLQRPGAWPSWGCWRGIAPCTAWSPAVRCRETGRKQQRRRLLRRMVEGGPALDGQCGCGAGRLLLRLLGGPPASCAYARNAPAGSAMRASKPGGPLTCSTRS